MMNRSKSIVLAFSMMIWMYVLIIAVIGLINYWFTLADVGLLLGSLIPLEFFARLFIAKTPRTSRTLGVYSISVLVGFVLVVLAFYQHNASIGNLVFSGLSLIAWLQYIFWYSEFGNREHANLKPGTLLPELSFYDIDGNEVLSTNFKDKKVIYMFYRGNWCPLCMAQIHEIAGEYRQLHELGVEVLLISPQPHDFTVKLAGKMNVPFHFLTDNNNMMARKLGIDQKNGIPFGFELMGYDSETVLPTVVITDENSNIIFLDKTDNYRVRPEPGTFLEVIRKERADLSVN